MTGSRSWAMRILPVMVLFVTAALVMAADVPSPSWPGFRGPHGDGLTNDVPATLPDKAKVLWQQPVQGMVYSGLVVADGLLVEMDHQKDKKDFVRCRQADTGEKVWEYSYDNEGDPIDFGSCPRATPLIYDGMVFACGARGQLCALELKTGKEVWTKNLVSDFGGTVPTWGYCSSPAMVDGKIVINPGSPRNSLLALEPKTGKTAWSSPGASANYGSILVAKIRGVMQLISYDQEEIAGRSLADGKVLWSHPLGQNPGYVVPTPVAFGDKVLLCAESAGRLIAVEKHGSLPEEFAGENEDFQVGNATPTLAGDLALAVVPDKGLMAIDMADHAKTLWTTGDKGPDTIHGDYATIFVGNGRALILNSEGELHLFAVSRSGAKRLGRMKACKSTMVAPALAGTKLYVRDESHVTCLDLTIPSK